MLVEQIQTVLVVTLDDPESLNTYDGATLKALRAAWNELDQNPELRAGVLTATGTRAFCAGANLQSVAAGGFNDPPYPELAESVSIKPVLAAIEGFCLGGGMMIACGCDLRVAGESAVFGLPEAQWNLPAQWLGALARQLLPAHALELALFGDARLPAQRLYEMGWITAVVDDGMARATSIEMAQRIGQMAPRAVRYFKELVTSSSWTAPSESLARGMEQAVELMGMSDTAEGARALREGRPSQFRDE